ncbi:MAG TPA: hypothetical protein DCL93_03545 [Faecalibacterium sp.]|nr:hypothetical protein [Faecalibacterium sp.]
MRRAKTGTLNKLRPAALSGRENWGATVVILDGNGYNKSCKAALIAAGIKILLRDARWKNQAETTFQLQKGVY